VPPGGRPGASVVSVVPSVDSRRAPRSSPSCPQVSGAIVLTSAGSGGRQPSCAAVSPTSLTANASTTPAVAAAALQAPVLYVAHACLPAGGRASHPPCTPHFSHTSLGGPVTRSLPQPQNPGHLSLRRRRSYHRRRVLILPGRHQGEPCDVRSSHHRRARRRPSLVGMTGCSLLHRLGPGRLGLNRIGRPAPADLKVRRCPRTGCGTCDDLPDPRRGQRPVVDQVEIRTAWCNDGASPR
jgi:hypothetical protein